MWKLTAIAGLLALAPSLAHAQPADAQTQPAPTTNAAPTTSTADASAPSTATASPSCADATIAAGLATLLRAERFADAHHAAVSARVMCKGAALDGTRIADAIALLRLEDREWAIRDLQELAPRHEVAALVLAWAYSSNRDHGAAQVVLARLPAPRAAAVQALGKLDNAGAFSATVGQLDASVQVRAREIAQRYRGARAKRPALAGVLSALLPGSGQLYAGSWQAAGVTLVLNGLFVAATVELAREKMYLSAAATGTAASFFYVGGIMNAVDLARRRNQIAQQPYARELEQLLLPELEGSFATP
ncbi:MAG TPA: hypothetical protein VIV11_01050 [Kofleriaceae bacterium]